MKVKDRRDGKVHVLHWDEELASKIDAVEAKYACSHPITEVRKFSVRNGVQNRRQCLTCGEKTSPAISKSEAPADLVSGDLDLAKNWEKRREEERSTVIQAQLVL